MMISSAVSTEKNRFVFSPPQFQLDPPGESPFEALPATSVTSLQGSLDWNWVETGIDVGISNVEGILDDILTRSQSDVQRFPSSAEVHANYALALMNRGRLNEAADEFSAAIKLAPRHFMSLANLARVRILQGRFDEAEALFERLSKDYPNELSPLVNLSYIFLRTGRLDKAILVLRKAIDIDAGAIFPRYLMAVSLLTLGKPYEAIGHLRLAARSEVRSPAIHQALGVAYLVAGDAKGAVRSFKAALTLAPDMKDAVHALANVLLQGGRTESLIELLAAYLEKLPDDIAARQILSEAYFEQKQYPSARLHLTTALRHLHGDDEGERKQRAKLLNDIGACFAQQGNDEHAEPWFTRSIELDPVLDPIPYHNLAKLYARKRDFVQAWGILEKCKEIFPGNHMTPVVQASVLMERGCYDEAIGLLREEIATGKALAESYGILGWYFTDFKRDPVTAQKVMLEGLRRYPRAPLVINNLAYALLMSGQPVEARKILMSLRMGETELESQDRAALTATWGLLYLWEGDFTKGKEFYERAEDIAHGSRQRDLPSAVRQKMHLELAKAHVRRNDVGAARIEIRRGLSIKRGREVYESDLTYLNDSLESSLDSDDQE